MILNSSRFALASLATIGIVASVAAQTPTQQQCFTDSIPTMTTTWADELVFPRFDPMLGDLKSVEFTLTTNLTGSAAYESLDNQAATISTDFSADIAVFRPGGVSPILVNTPTQSFVSNAAAYDGTTDFGGTSGGSFPNISVMETNVLISPPPSSDLALFTGPAGNPGTITLPVIASGTSSGTGAGNLLLQFMQEASASLEVCYNYCIGNAKCTGDGGDQMGCTDCPCMNNSMVGSGTGCLNSSAEGALLIAGGVASAANDTLNFIVTGAAPNQIGVLFSGTSGQPANAANPCFGLQSGVQDLGFDGLRCVGGTIRRHQTRNSDVNGDFGVINAPWGPPGGPPQGLIARGAWQPGQTICWQVTYRDDPTQVCMRGINSTQALELTILP